jgi:hypothetical protein
MQPPAGRRSTARVGFSVSAKDFFLVWGKIPIGSEKSGFQKYRKYRPKYR